LGEKKEKYTHTQRAGEGRREETEAGG